LNDDFLMSQKDQTPQDAERYRLLKRYLLRNGFVIHQRIPEDQEPFVMDAAFYGPTFDDAVDSLPVLEGTSRHKEPHDPA